LTISYAPVRERTVLYLHGFSSSPAGRKVALLRERLEREGFRIVAPDLNRPSFTRLDFDAMVETALAESRVSRPDVVVGSSLGALVALEACRRGLAAPLVLIAPALGFHSRWTEKLPNEEPPRFFHHATGKETAIHRAFFEQMAKLDVDRQPPAVRVAVVMGVADESVPFALVEDVWCRWVASKQLRAGSRLVEIEGGDHGLVEHVDEIAEEIRAAAENRISRPVG
jgi:pimeloyl-ACP methyl ester carboxylesterase